MGDGWKCETENISCHKAIKWYSDYGGLGVRGI